MRAASLVLLAVCLASGCGRSEPYRIPDAGAKPPAARPRSWATGDLPLDLTRSKLSLTIVKDRDTATPVNATLSFRDGSVSLHGPAPSARLTIDIDSFDSMVPIRNERVRKIFFETFSSGWDSAELVVSSVSPEIVPSLQKSGRISHAKIEGKVTLHGKSAAVVIDADITYDAAGRLSVKSSVPVVVKVSDFGLTDNLGKLATVCLHNSIDDVVIVDVTLEFSTL